ncbi:MAG: GNAT family N-acetyltransferase [Chloroflexi bacterium]|jgi:diamine N-acetyltransferase|nr:GNAT family N-acetyltransferase [Chloroflexota bacterium]
MPRPESTVSLQEVTEENLGLIFKLGVREEQEQFVALNTVSIAQAYFARERAWFRAIYADDTPVGFLMLDDDPHKAEYILWRLMVDARYQGMSFGRRAMELLIAHVKTRPNAVELKTSYVPGEGSPGPFYHKLGFVETGEVLEGENVVSLKLTYGEGESMVPAPGKSKDEVLVLVRKFQEGYMQRDPANLEAIMELFGPEKELEVIGTSAVTPGEGEWCKGRTAVRDLLEGDWEHWGDVVFDLEGMQIFVQGDVAWLATRGTVTDVITADYKYEGFVSFAQAVLEDESESAKSKILDITRLGNSLISSLLLPETHVWPFRFTAVAVKREEVWRFHQMQFSFATTWTPDERVLPGE